LYWTINGEEREVTVEPRQTLLDVLRNNLGLTGTKRKAAATATAGTCTVLIDGKAVSACLIFAVETEGLKS